MSVGWEASRVVVKFRKFWKGCCNSDSGEEGIFAFLGVLARRWLVACEAWSGAICDLPLGICMQWNRASWHPQALLDVETGRFQE